jgi:hypothetical protein
MSPPVLIALIALITIAAAGWLGHRIVRRRRRDAIAARPLPDEWLGIVERNLPLYRRLPADLQRRLHRRIRLFLHEKRFFGFDGVEIDDEIRVTVAANACLLVLDRSVEAYDGFTSIYVYPSTFVVEHERWDGRVRSVGRQARLGESWHRGPLVLAWDAALHGTRDPRDGHNVILHEFAHKLDGADGLVDGAPPLRQRSRYTSWARVMTREYRQLRRRADARARTVMDHYGATEPQEFFAVLVETFYEKPRQLKKRHPELYAEMQACFGVDPVAWHEPAGRH